MAPSSRAGVAIGALPVGPQGRLLQLRVPLAQLEAAHDHRALAAGVDDHLGAHLALAAVFVLRSARRRPARLRTALRARGRLRAPRRRARGRCRASAGRTRCAAPARSASIRAACGPGSRTARTACRCELTNCTLYFLTKWLAFILSQHVEPLEHPVGLGNQRLADVEARKMLALEELDAVALLGDERRGGRAGRAAADDDDVNGRSWEDMRNLLRSSGLDVRANRCRGFRAGRRTVCSNSIKRPVLRSDAELPCVAGPDLGVHLLLAGPARLR